MSYFITRYTSPQPYRLENSLVTTGSEFESVKTQKATPVPNYCHLWSLNIMYTHNIMYQVLVFYHFAYSSCHYLHYKYTIMERRVAFYKTSFISIKYTYKLD